MAGEKKEKPRVHKELDGFEFKIDPFGEISSTIDIDELNKFLNKNVSDKKLKDRDDLDELKKDTES